MKKKSTQAKKLKYVHRMAWLVGGPALIVQGLFGWLPLAVGFVLAFQKFYLFRPSPFVGFSNFQSVLIERPLTAIAFRNTFYYAALSIGLTFLVPIFVAILLMEMSKKIIRIMMILWFIPVGSMAGLVIWKWMYNPQYGLFNGILTWLNLPTLRWLNDPRLAMICLILPGLIMYGPGLIYIATIQGIPDELYEAADLEGAGMRRKIWSITLPRLRPIISMMLILGVIGSLQVFSQPYVMTGGGPGYATITVVMSIYQLAFQSMKYGKGAALSVTLFLVTMILVSIQRKYIKEDIDR